MYNDIATKFVIELRNRRSVRIIVSDSSEEENDKVQKRKRGRPQKVKIKEETIDDILQLCKTNLPVQRVTISGEEYNKCIYTNDLYDDCGLLVGIYDIESHSIKKY